MTSSEHNWWATESYSSRTFLFPAHQSSCTAIHILQNQSHTPHLLSAVRYLTFNIPSATPEWRQRLRSSPNASHSRRLPYLGPSLPTLPARQGFSLHCRYILKLSSPTFPLHTNPHWPGRSSTVLGRFSILPYCIGALHALVGSISSSRHHSRDGVTHPTLWLDVSLRLCTDHHDLLRTPVWFSGLPLPGQAVSYSYLQDELPSSCRQ